MTLIAAELTAIAVRHGHVPGRDFGVRLTRSPRCLRPEVTDTRSSGGPGVETRPDLLDLDRVAARLPGRRGLDAFRIGRMVKRHDFPHGVLSLLNGEPLDD
ncbi:hypothetical protein [Streptomyces niveus]|uniref:hypothetical protein n=1 Tax=Streptomyces niveus TaxID=193462 RepID=UPI003F4D7BAA